VQYEPTRQLLGQRPGGKLFLYPENGSSSGALLAKTRAQARADVFDYIEVLYNRQRRHSALDYQSPSNFEALLRAA
jgi:transposase InsO family protein